MRTFSGSNRNDSMAPYGANTWMSCSLVNELSRLPIHRERVGVCIWFDEFSDLGETARFWFEEGAERYADARLAGGSTFGKWTLAARPFLDAATLSVRKIPAGLKLDDPSPE